MNKYTLITGASSGIGYELAKICAANHHNLVLVARSTDKLVQLETELQQQYKIQTYLITKDLSEPQASQEIYDELNAQNIQIDVLINNAGFGAHGQFDQLNWATLHQMMQVNMQTLTHLTYLFLPNMLKNKSGKILNVASTAAFFPGPYMAVYYATKSYVLSLSEALAQEYKKDGITITALCPGPTQSNFQRVAQSENTLLFKNRQLPTSQEVAQFGYDKLMRGTSVAIHGGTNRLMIKLASLIPRNLIPPLVEKMQK